MNLTWVERGGMGLPTIKGIRVSKTNISIGAPTIAKAGLNGYAMIGYSQDGDTLTIGVKPCKEGEGFALQSANKKKKSGTKHIAFPTKMQGLVKTASPDLDPVFDEESGAWVVTVNAG